MIEGDKPMTSGGNLKAAPMDVYLDWICIAWDSLSKDLIAKSFLTCGISKTPDGHDDEHIHVFKVIKYEYRILQIEFRSKVLFMR
jgi:hypothetical protein